MIFQIAGAGILTAFFIIFFGKMTAQKRQGMKPVLFKRGNKSTKVFITEMVLKFFVFLNFTAQIVSIALDTHIDLLPLGIAGAVIGIAGVTVLGIAIRTMAGSWRTEIPEGERTELVTDGIFRVSRNPAFLGFDLMFIGLSAMFFNPVSAALTICCIVMYHLQTVREERFLTATFGAQYLDYMSRTRRYLGTKSN